MRAMLLLIPVESGAWKTSKKLRRTKVSSWAMMHVALNPGRLAQGLILPTLHLNQAICKNGQIFRLSKKAQALAVARSWNILKFP